MNVDDARKRHEFLVRYQTPSGSRLTVPVFANNTTEAIKRYEAEFGHRGPVLDVFRCVAKTEVVTTRKVRILPSR